MNTASISRIGIIAGQGDFPVLMANAARGCGTQVVAIAINGFASPELSNVSDRIHWVELGQLDKAIKLLRQEDVHHLAMAGRLPHNSILQYRHFDWRAMKLLASAANKRADALLGLVVSEFEKEGIQIIDSSLFLKSLMPQPGLITPARPLTEKETAAVEFGWPIAKTLAGQDIGQTVVVKDGMVVALEGAEGTDECIIRAGKLAGPGCVVIKVSKPRQDLRFDIPIIGPGTVKTMAQAGAAALVLSAGRSLIFHRDDVAAAAHAANIGIQAMEDEPPSSSDESK